MLSPWMDLLAIGGASVIALALILAFGIHPLKGQDLGSLMVLGVVVNWPHFVASYRLLYARRESVLRYRAASIYVPAILVGYAVYGLVTVRSQPIHVDLIALVGALYLARHYTGQTFGMMASFAHIEGLFFAPSERRLVRASLDVLMLWHLLWAAAQSMSRIVPGLVGPLQQVYQQAGWLLGVGFAVGLVGLGRMSRRLGRLPPPRVWMPWLAIQVWYLAMARDPSTLLAVQVAHALQYLIFPLRVEMNRSGAAEGSPPAAKIDWKTLALFLGTWILVGLAVFEGMEPLFRACFVLAGGDGGLPRLVSSVLISAIAIHHYFIDGALYKLRNPQVRRDLFSHLAPATVDRR